MIKKLAIEVCIIGFLGVTLFNVFASDKATVQIHLGIENAFDASIDFMDSYFMSGGILYTSDSNHILEISASSTSEYTIGGDLAITVSGSGSGIYTKNAPVALTATSGHKNIQAEFINQFDDRVKSNKLEIYYDVTPPTTPTILSPSIGLSTDAAGVLFQWTASQDSGSGLSHYAIIISKSPSMLNPITFSTTQTSLLVNSTLLPEGQLYRYIRAYDNVGNNAQSFPGFFSLKKPGTNGRNSIDDTSTDGRLQDDTLYESDNTDTTTGNERENTHGSAPEIDQDYSDYGLSYYFPNRNNDLSVLDIIKNNNRLIMLLNRAQQSRDNIYSPGNEHGSATISVSTDGADSGSQITLPKYLQATGANISELRHHLELIKKYFPDESVKQYIKSIISLLTPKRYGGMFLLLLLFAYDIEFYKRRYFTQLNK